MVIQTVLAVRPRLPNSTYIPYPSLGYESMNESIYLIFFVSVLLWEKVIGAIDTKSIIDTKKSNTSHRLRQKHIRAKGGGQDLQTF